MGMEFSTSLQTVLNQTEPLISNPEVTTDRTQRINELQTHFVLEDQKQSKAIQLLIVSLVDWALNQPKDSWKLGSSSAAYINVPRCTFLRLCIQTNTWKGCPHDSLFQAIQEWQKDGGNNGVAIAFDEFNNPSVYILRNGTTASYTQSTDKIGFDYLPTPASTALSS